MEAPTQNELLENVIMLDEKPKNRSSIDQYRKLIIIMRSKGFSKKEISEYLCRNSCQVKYTTLVHYLKRNPITNEEMIRTVNDFSSTEKTLLEERNNRLKQILGEEKIGVSNNDN